MGVADRFELMRASAHNYVERGLAVLPLFYLRDDGLCACGDIGCSRVGKHPWYGERWPEVLATEAAHVNALWSDPAHPWNIGIAGDQTAMVDAGKSVHGDLLVIHANGGNAVRSQLKEFGYTINGVLGIPKTGETITPTGGRHLYFRIPRSLREIDPPVFVVANRVALDEFPGLSVISRGGYVVAPPSCEAEGVWQWAPESGTITDAPEGLLAYLSQACNLTVHFDTHITDTSPWYRGMRGHSHSHHGLRLIDHHGRQLRYTVGMGWGFWYDRWITDHGAGKKGGDAMAQVVGLVRRLPDVLKEEAEPIRQELQEALAAGDEDWEKEVRKRLNVKLRAIETANNATFIDKSIELAEKDIRVMTSITAWNRHHHLMGVKNGVVDLKAGRLLPMSQDLLITKSAHVTYDPDARDTLWETFISEVCEGDQSKIKFLQKAIGLTLTGERKDNFFMIHGASGTGKSTLLDLIFETMGGYSQKLDATAITEKKGKMQSVAEDKYDRGKLLGCRFVYVSEIQEGADLKDDMIKPMTGDGTISGRLPYRENFDIPATMKLWIGTNHQPFVKDDAIWRRVKAIRFRYRPDPMDETVRQRLLRPDGPAMRAFFAWAVRGAVEYYANPDLNFCADVEQETAIYKLNEDLLGQFLEEYYEVGDPEIDVITLQSAYDQYANWNFDTGRKAWPKDVMRRKLVDAGYMKPADRINVYGLKHRTGAMRMTPLGAIRSAPTAPPATGTLFSPPGS